MLGLILVVAWLLVGSALGVVLSRWQSRKRQRFVLEHLEGMNLTVLRCTPSLQPFRPRWNKYYWVLAQDGQGRRRSGTAAATGRLRRKVWVIWADDPPANAREALRRTLWPPLEKNHRRASS